jgi:tetratricopeptide (TPR) repeat protein
MKKQKTATVEARNIPTDNELAILAFSRSDADVAVISSKIASAILRSRSEATLIICGDAKSEAPELAELFAKGRLKLAGNSPDAFIAAIEEAKATWTYVCDVSENFDAGKAISCFTQNKKAFSRDDVVYAGEFTKKSFEKKPSLVERAGSGLYNLFAQLLLPSQARDYTHRYYYFSRKAAEAVFSPSFRTPIEWLCKAAYESIPVEHFMLAGKFAQDKLQRIGAVLKLFFATRFNWFFTDAIKPVKRQATGQHPSWRIAYFAFVLIALVAMPLLSFDYGISWDAKRHNQYGYEMLRYFTSFGEDQACLSETSPIQEFRFYGEHFNVIAAFINTYIKPFGEFETRHVLNALYGFIAMLFASLAAKEMGGWRAGFFAFVFIFLSPVFLAHSMNNPTDIPFAAGCAVALYYLLKILKNLPSPKPSYMLMCGAGIGMAIGARVGGIVWYGYTGMFMGLHWLWLVKSNGWSEARKMIWPYAKILLAVVITGHIIGLSLWPFGQQAPFTNWYVALKRSTDASFFTFNHELFEGVRMYMAKVPWYYLPKFIAINSPLFVLAGLVASVALVVPAGKYFTNRWMFPVLMFILAFPIVYAEFQNMYYYNGWRHYLFVYPPLIVLAAGGWEMMLRLFNQKVAKLVIAAVLVALVSLPLTWMVRNHPNECAYFNELTGGLKGAYGNYETDYYSNSCRAAAEWLAQHEPKRKVIVAINNEPLTASYYANKVNPNMQFQWVREYEEQKPFWDYQLLTSRTYSKNELMNGSFPPKGTIYAVEADGVPLAVVVKREDWSMPLGYKALDNKKLDSAIYYFHQATKYNSKDEETWRMLGFAYMTAGQFDTAETMLKKSIAIYPENYSSYTNLGLIYFNKKDFNKAIEYFSIATKYKENLDESWYYSALAYLNLEDYSNAIKNLSIAAKHNTSIPDVYFYLGKAYDATGKLDKAASNYELCLGINQNFAQAWAELASVYGKLGRQQDAEYCMNKYRSLGGK